MINKKSGYKPSLRYFIPKQHKGLQISFAWLFAIIVGAFILFLAIYASVKLIGSEQGVQDAKTGKEIGILLNPLETGLESSVSASVTFPVETRIYGKCNNNGYFGRQIIQVSQKSLGKWSQTDIDVGFSNKYIFSEVPLEGKKFLIFSKPFEFPFKVASLIYMTEMSKEYCFLGAPGEIMEEIENLNQENLFTENCSESSVQVCFDGVGCDVDVSYGAGYVEKNGDTMYFNGDALMYAAIFSEKDIYECQVKRLMQRTSVLASLYKNKASFVSRVECNSDLSGELLALINSANNLDNSIDIMQVDRVATDLGDKNDYGVCRLW